MTVSAGDSPPERGSVRPLPPERITVALIPKAGADLQALQERTGLSKTDITNRAISLYEFFDAQIQNGNDVIVQNKHTGEMQRVMIL